MKYDPTSFLLSNCFWLYILNIFNLLTKHYNILVIEISVSGNKRSLLAITFLFYEKIEKIFYLEHLTLPLQLYSRKIQGFIQRKTLTSVNFLKKWSKIVSFRMCLLCKTTSQIQVLLVTYTLPLNLQDQHLSMPIW